MTFKKKRDFLMAAQKIILFLDETFFLRKQYGIGKMLDGAQNILFNVDKV